MGENNFNLINARVTFKNVPLHKLEQFAFKDITAAYEAFKKITDVSECVIIQNAFRIEVFMVIDLEKGEIPDLRRAEGKGLTINQIKETWLSLTELEQIEIDHFDQTFEVFKNTEVYSSLLRLASGLNSIVVGREEILDEIKKSFSTAKQANDSGPVLNKLFDNTIRTATRIRNSTEISNGIISLGEIAIKTAEDKVGLDEKKNVLLMGTGEIAAMVAQSLNKKDKKFSVTSLTIERATGFSQILGGTPIKIEDVFSGFDKFDIVFVATTSDYLLVNYNKIRRVMENKKKGTFILDISNPRAVDEKISTLPGIKLMFRDQIDEMFQEFVKASRAKVPAVENLIGKEAPILEATMK